MRVTQYYHRDGRVAVPEPVVIELITVIENLHESTFHGNAPAIRQEIINEMVKLGWSDEFRVSPDSNITITSMKNKIATCVQFGNVGRMYADLLKLQVVFERGRCDGGVYILPTKNSAKALASNLGYAERLQRELKLFRSIINIPLHILAVE